MSWEFSLGFSGCSQPKVDSQRIDNGELVCYNVRIETQYLNGDQSMSSTMTAKEWFLEEHKDSPEGPKELCVYSQYIIRGRWPEAEPTIVTDPYYAYRYAYDIIKGRWLEAEPIIMTNSECTYLYSRYVIKRRWPEAEPIFMTDPYWLNCYLSDVLGI